MIHSKNLRLTLFFMSAVCFAAASIDYLRDGIRPAHAQSAGGIKAVVSTVAEKGHVLKSSPGGAYGVYATNLTATAGFLVVLNATTVPADGAITPIECIPLPANGNAFVNYNPAPSAIFSTGIVAAVTSATTCFTLTTGVITAFFHGAVL